MRLPGRPAAICAAGLWLALAGCAAVPETACGLHPAGSLPVERQAGEPMVTVTVNGTPLRLVLNSGAQVTAVSEDAVQRAHLPVDMHIAPLVGVGGRSERHFVRFEGATLGAIPLAPFLGAAGVFGASAMGGQGFDGFLGADVLGRYDIDLDLPRGRALFYTGRLCDPSAIPWTVPPRSLDAYARAVDYDPRLYVPVALNGTALNALLDTGAVHSVLSGSAFSLVPPPREPVATARPARMAGLGRTVVTARMERFGTLSVGGTTMARPALLVLDDLDTQVLLGNDYAGTRRVWLSFSSGRAFVDRLGP